MTTTFSTVASLSDDALLAHVSTLAGRERQATADLIAALAELDARRLYLGAGCSSLFTYCTQVLHLSEHAAYGRIEAARLARRIPEVIGRMADGSLTLTAVCLLGPVLTDARPNCWTRPATRASVTSSTSSRACDHFQPSRPRCESCRNPNRSHQQHPLRRCRWIRDLSARQWCQSPFRQPGRSP